MRPNKVNGLTEAEHQRRCVGKHRWSDELSANAGAIFAIESFANADKLWTYHCPMCKGWHLTRNPQQGKEPAAVMENDHE